MPIAGEVFYLRLGNRVLRSFLDPDLTPYERIEFAFYAMFVMEAWFTNLKEKDDVVKKASCWPC
jgi:hypothetical protein